MPQVRRGSSLCQVCAENGKVFCEIGAKSE